MEHSKTGAKLKFWPTPQDYNEAVQNPHLNIGDPSLRSGAVATDAMGLPRPITGAFASVYKMENGQDNFALRCFLRDIPDTQWRYGRIADFLDKNPLIYAVKFKFHFQGIKVNGKWFPSLTMDWIDGLTLDTYVKSKLDSGGLDPAFPELFKKMCLDLHDAGIAHGDLQHGNIMVRDDQLVLVDYDGMFVPYIDSPHSNELGHRNYQHPDRTARHFGPYLDAFSSWVIYLSLKALCVDAELFDKLGAGEDCLLFRRDDYLDPRNSCAFAVLERHSNEEIVNLARYVRSLLSMKPELVPPLAAPPVVPEWLEPISRNAPTTRAQQFARASLPKQTEPEATGTALPSSVLAAIARAAQVPVKPHAIEPELLKSAPRKTKINQACLRTNPELLQIGTCLVPVFGLMFFSSFVHRGGTLEVAWLDMVWGLPIFCIFSVLTWWRPLLHRHIVKQGTAVLGTIIEKKVLRTTKVRHFEGGDLPYEKAVCQVTYEYPRLRAGKVQNVTSTVELNHQEYRELDEGEQVTIVYLPDSYSLIYKFSHYRAL